MENIGQQYAVIGENLSLVSNTGTAYDFIQFAAGATVPILLYKIILTSPQVSATYLRVELVPRTSASTGGTLITPVNFSLAGGTAATVVTYNNIGSTGHINANAAPYDASEWNQFAPYEWNVLPSAVIIPSANWVSLYLPAPPAAAIAVSVRAEFIEIK